MLVRSIVPPGCGAGTQAGYVMLNDIPMRVDEATDVSELYAEVYDRVFKQGLEKREKDAGGYGGDSGDDGPGRDGR